MCLNFTTIVFLKNLISAKSDMHMMYDLYDTYSTFLLAQIMEHNVYAPCINT
jgi:hypothetical protein